MSQFRVWVPQTKRTPESTFRIWACTKRASMSVNLEIRSWSIWLSARRRRPREKSGWRNMRLVCAMVFFIEFLYPKTTCSLEHIWTIAWKRSVYPTSLIRNWCCSVWRITLDLFHRWWMDSNPVSVKCCMVPSSLANAVKSRSPNLQLQLLKLPSTITENKVYRLQL